MTGSKPSILIVRNTCGWSCFDCKQKMDPDETMIELYTVASNLKVRDCVLCAQPRLDELWVALLNERGRINAEIDALKRASQMCKLKTRKRHNQLIVRTLRGS